jgi:hypothetical protein
MEKLIETVNEKLELDTETAEMLAEGIDMGIKHYKKTKTQLFMRGVVIGALSTTSLLSMVTVLVLISG